jgi:predicted nucleic acid-binding protein
VTSIAYVDASALVKLIVLEADSVRFQRWYLETERIVTSRIGVIETRRAAGRHPHDAGELRSVIASVEVIELDRQVADRAAAAVPPGLRTLDAIHIATALELGPALDAFVTYDDRLAAAARAAGLPVVHPAA